MGRKALIALAALLLAATASAEELRAGEILDRPVPFRIERVRGRFTYFDQDGRGFQSQAGPVGGPGSEQVTVAQPQFEVVAKQGRRLTHRLWFPVDVITAASPDAVDAISTASRVNKTGTLDLLSTYKVDAKTDISVRTGVHVEENFRSFNFGVGVARSFADDNTVLSASLNEVYDWFERNMINGGYYGRRSRSSANGNLGLTQLLSPSTVGYVGYGVTVQNGTLGNTWNAVPLTNGKWGEELLPGLRHRHAFTGRLAQYLPWRGVWKGMYRFYIDGWGLVSHTLETELYQRLGPWLWARVNYRFHQQSAVDFYTERAAPQTVLRTSDSDLSAFNAQTVGGKIAIDLAGLGRPALRDFYVDVGFDYYFRSNGLHVNVYSCGLGFRF